MTKNNHHSKLINNAARAVLRPLGFQQKGRSRVWFADKRCWALIIEFQPSGFGKGSYLNVAASWFWHPSPWAFDYVHRAGGFVAFESQDQFQPAVEKLAQVAANEAEILDVKFSSLKDIAAYLKQQAQDARMRSNPWTLYHAAIACRLAGEREFSAKCLSDLSAQKPQTEWMKELQVESKHLVKLLDRAHAFRDDIQKKIAQTRAAMKLPPLPESVWKNLLRP